MSAEDPLFILYTSGSTGQPKGVLHTSGGYLVFVSMTHQYVFDYHEGDIYWCTADVGWVTGHSYILYGPLANGATTLMFEGVPNYPDNSRFWNVIDKHKVNIFYTAPTAIRALMQAGDAPVTKTSRASLRLLGSVGEPINPEAWEWYHRVVGDNRCPIVDTWWQTETGGIMITPLPGATRLKPGSATQPFFGVVPEIVDADGKVLEGECQGNLCIARSWPGQMRTVYGDHARFEQTYFSTYKGKYFTGDGCRRDADGFYWITGRVDDVINVSGHRMGTAEVESSLVAHAKVSEAAVVGYPHDIKGQGIYAYVTLMTGTEPSDDLRKELVAWVRKDIGPIASPTRSSSRPACPRRAPARSCAASCARSPRTSRAAWAIPRRSPIPLLWTIWSSIARTGKTKRCRAANSAVLRRNSQRAARGPCCAVDSSAKLHTHCRGRSIPCRLATRMSGHSRAIGALSRHCHRPLVLAGRFPRQCGFQVIYFDSNIFFAALRKPVTARSCKTPG